MGSDCDTLPAEGPRVLCDGLAAAGRGDVNTLQQCLDTGKKWRGYDGCLHGVHFFCFSQG